MLIAIAASAAPEVHARGANTQLAPPPARIHVAVAICDAERVAPAILDKATRIVDAVYADIGVDIEWTDECGGGASALEVHLVAHDPADGTVSNVTMGFAESGTSAATILYDRVDHFARRYHIKREVLLGYGIAHELGHLLLPPNSHSPAGVMRSNLDLQLASAKRLRFTSEQAASILERLEASPAAIGTR
jgi:hypothetical protein